MRQIRIVVATDNDKSRGIPSRLGFKEEIVESDKLEHYGERKDAATYTMTRSIWTTAYDAKASP